MKKNHFKIGGNALSVILSMICATPMLAQVGKTVHGTVKEQSISLSGVLVTEKGTENYTFTDDDGRYDITLVTPNATLVFETPELLVREEEVKNRSSISIEFDTEGIGLQEVVVNAGYYTVKDKERTGSIARVTAKEIENQPVNNVLSAIQGRMAGVSIVQNSGVPGGGYDIQIRGRNSLRAEGNKPLYIIDGVPITQSQNSLYAIGILPANEINPLNRLNPNDIESVEVLKDADATAIYGSRGANGVILITTKQGKNGLNLNFKASQSISNAMNRLKLLNTEQYLNVREAAFNNDGIQIMPNTAYDVNGVWNKNNSTNWWETLLGGKAFSNNIEFNISGSNERSSYSINFSNNTQSTIFKNDFRYKSKNISANFNHFSKNNRFNITLTNQVNFSKNNLINDDVTKKALLLSPNSPNLYQEDGTLNWENNTFTNPVAAYKTTLEYDSKNILSNVKLFYLLTDNLSLKLNGGMNYQNMEEWSLKPYTTYNPSVAVGQSSAYSIAYRHLNSIFSYILEPQIEWNKQLNNHQFNVILGGTYQEELNDIFSATGNGFESNALMQNLAAAKTQRITNSYTTNYVYEALYGRVNYKYKDTYIINLTGRRDGSSRFGPTKRFANFGSVGAAWVFSNAFNLNSTVLSFGKLRGSIGITGNDQIGDYQFRDNYSVTNNIYNGIVGLAPSRLYNPNYSWETTSKKEIALELGFWRNKLRFNASWYHNKSSNQLVGVPQPITTGFNSILQNLNATILNKGLELELNAAWLNKDLKWETAFNISYPTNKLSSFPNLEASTYRNLYELGYPTSIVKVYQYEGIDPETGLYKFTDFNGDGRISSPDDNKVIENIGIHYHGGLNNSVSYKNWNLSFLFQFVKQKNWNYNKLMSIPGSMNNQPIEVLDVWSPTNLQGTYMPYSSGADTTKNLNHLYYTTSTAAISDASFIRLKNIQLMYNLHLNSKSVKSLSLYLQGQNMWTITNYFGLDPEFTTLGYLPPLKTYAIGFNLKF